jgi:hypothetical protein
MAAVLIGPHHQNNNNNNKAVVLLSFPRKSLFDFKPGPGLSSFRCFFIRQTSQENFCDSTENLVTMVLFEIGSLMVISSFGIHVI